MNENPNFEKMNTPETAIPGIEDEIYDLLKSQEQGGHLFTDAEEKRREELKKNNSKEWKRAQRRIAYENLTPDEQDQVDKESNQEHFKQFMKERFNKDV